MYFILVWSRLVGRSLVRSEQVWLGQIWPGLSEGRGCCQLPPGLSRIGRPNRCHFWLKLTGLSRSSEMDGAMKPAAVRTTRTLLPAAVVLLDKIGTGQDSGTPIAAVR